MSENMERVGRRRARSAMMLIGIVAAMVLAACAKDDVSPAAGSGASGTTSSAPSPDANDAASSGGGGRYGYGSGGGGGGSGEDISKADAVVKASDFQFSPGTITIESGEVLGIANSSAQTAHTFTIDAEGIDEALDPGSSTSLTIDLAPGRYPFICRYHESAGMTGTLVVT